MHDARTVRARAPGRVNLIGEHTDYNDGFVMPAAIGLGTDIAATVRPHGRTVHVYSESQNAGATIDLDHLDAAKTGHWSEYVRGVLLQLARCAVPLSGCDLTVTSTLPVGGGLSSSAALEVATALAMLELVGATLDRLDIARLAQRAEVEQVGARSGIMDQFAVLFGMAGCVVLLDTRSLAYEYLRLPADTTLVIANSMVKHALAAGEYNARRAQCEAAVEALRGAYPQIGALRDVGTIELEAARDRLTPLLYRRAKHVVSENARVLEAAHALGAGNPGALGELMNASHASLRDDYEVSSRELDTLVALAREAPGVYGSRMTGGGFGGCTVTLVDGDRAEELRARIRDGYRRAFGVVPELYDGTPADGAGVCRA